jgi:hypothetical protein
MAQFLNWGLKKVGGDFKVFIENPVTATFQHSTDIATLDTYKFY